MMADVKERLRAHPANNYALLEEAANYITSLEQERDRLRKALEPFANRVFNDNSDLTVDTSAFSYDQIVAAYFAHRRAAARAMEDKKHD